MAEVSIVLISQDRHFIPTKEAFEAVKSLMENYFPDRGNEVEYRISKNPRLITSHDSFEELSCPECGETVMRFELDEDDDGETWWDHFEQKLDESDDATTVRIQMPCCNHEVEVVNINFGRDAGFSKFEFRLCDPGDHIEVTDEQKSSLEKILECPLIQITSVNS